MLDIIEKILARFRPCFSRARSFSWFVIVVIGFMVRQDHLGVTSFIRDMDLNPKWYESLIHFFRAKSWSAPTIRNTWYETLLDASSHLIRIADRLVMVGDGVKQPKEAFHMPGVKKMTQESDTCSKPEYIHGHMFGALAIVAGSLTRKFCIPLKINLQEGLRHASEWAGSEISGESHVTQMVEASFEAAKVIGKSYLLLDRYFLTRSALDKLDELNADYTTEDGFRLVEIITKAKKNCVAYRPLPSEIHPHRGRPRLKGSAVTLSNLFDCLKYFKTGKVQMYGELKDVRYFTCVLLWGQKRYKPLRFVLVECEGRQSILVSTDVSLDAITIIKLYATRFSIEETFREFKQQIGGFCYHFWTKAISKLNHFAKKSDPDPLESVLSKPDRDKVLNTIKAIEGYVLFASISMGILQLLALNETPSGDVQKCRYLRTLPKERPSEATVMYYFHRRFYPVLMKTSSSFVTRLILEKMAG